MESIKQFFTSGIPTTVEIEIPENMEKCNNLPAVILCHGHSRHRNDGLDVLSHMLAEKGIAVFRFDFRGCGKDARRKYFEYCASEWPADLIHAINYVESIPCIDKSRIGIAGISMGACTSVYVAGSDTRVKTVVSMSGIGDCYEWMEYVWKCQGGDFAEFKQSVLQEARIAAATGESKLVNVLEMYHFPEADKNAKLMEALADENSSEYIAWDSMQELLMYKPLEKCPNITQPIFFLVGGDDFLVPHEQSEKMYETVKSKEKLLKVYPGMEHNIPADPKKKTAFADIVDWYEKYL